MPKAVKKCKVCGKEYEACRTFRHDNAFRWQDVACSPEHGAEYFAAVLAAREKNERGRTDVQEDK